MVIHYRIGDTISEPVKRSGMQVMIVPGSVHFHVFCKETSPLGIAMKMGGDFQIGFIDANPFGWFFLNDGLNSLDTNFAMARVPKDALAEMREALEGFCLENKAGAIHESGLPLAVVFADLNGRIFRLRPMPMDRDAWHIFGATLLSHPVDVPENVLAVAEKRFERKHQTMIDFDKAPHKWVKSSWLSVEAAAE